jgi:hypothetical protein
MKYENPICEIVELDMDIVTVSGEPETPIIPTA